MIVTLAMLVLMTLMLSPFISYSSSSSAGLTNNSSNNSELFTPESIPFGLTYNEWTARWWQWAYSIPSDVHPAYDDSGNIVLKARADLSGF